MREIAAEDPWRGKLVGAERARVRIESAEWYYRLLRAACGRVDVWRTTYYHPLADARPSSSGSKARGLRPFLDPLDPHQREDYLARYTERLARALSVTQRRGAVAVPETLHGGPALEAGGRAPVAVCGAGARRVVMPASRARSELAHHGVAGAVRAPADKQPPPIALARNRMVRMPSPAPFG